MEAALIVLYHPRIDEVIDNIRTFADAVDKVLVWRNSEEDIVIPADLESKLILMGEKKNVFIAEPMNKALDWCIQNGYDYLLTMDQDSKWENASYFIAKALSSEDNEVAVFAPYVVGQYAKPETDYNAESVISSGSLINVSIAKALGGFREDYKIYWVDGEYCYWARINGYKVRVLHDCSLVQRFGKQTKTLFGFTTSNYSPEVYYFLIRNMLWMKREFPKGVSLKTILYTLMFNLRGIILGEKHKIRKIHSINKAIVHGLFHSYASRS